VSLRVEPELSEWLATIRGVTHPEARSPAATLPPLMLRPEEAAAIAAALAVAPKSPYAAHGFTALFKVLEALEPDPGRRQELVSSSLSASADASKAEKIRAVLDRAVVRGRVVLLGYHDGKGRPSRREVEPQLLVRSSEHWFLVAWCRERQAPRWFRLDRITSARICAEPVPRRDPALFGIRADSHPAGRALDRTAEPPPSRGNLRVIPGGRR
jgi:predicted DNA-binding transcriptional regulator YafY